MRLRARDRPAASKASAGDGPAAPFSEAAGAGAPGLDLDPAAEVRAAATGRLASP